MATVGVKGFKRKVKVDVILIMVFMGFVGFCHYHKNLQFIISLVIVVMVTLLQVAFVIQQRSFAVLFVVSAVAKETPW